MSAGTREKWRFSGRELVDGVPHLMWRCEAVEAKGRGRHRAEVPDWEWFLPVDDFKEVTVGTQPAVEWSSLLRTHESHD